MFNENNNINVAIYVRVSTEMQEEKDSLKNQISRCQAYCEMKGYRVVKIYKDVESGSKDDRPDFQKMLSDMKLDIFQAIVVTELSRISRKLTTLLNFLERFQKYDIDFVSITQNIDTSTPIGRVFFQLIGIFAEFEREQTRERVAHTMKNMAMSGKFTGGVVPYGYRLVGKKLVVNEEKALIVQKAYAMYISGINRSQISEKLGIPYTTLNRMLTTPFYAGKKIYSRRKTHPVTGKKIPQPKDKWLISEGEHEAVIDEETYNTAQSIFYKNYKSYVKYEDNPNFLLSGLLRCYNGHKIYGTVNNGHYYYLCYKNSTKYNSNERCTKKPIMAKELEQEVLDYILSLKEIPEKINEFEKDFGKKDENKIKEKISKFTQQISTLENKKKKLLDLFLEDKITEEVFQNKNSNFIENIKTMENEVTILKSKLDINENNVKNAELFGKILREFNNDLDRMKLKMLLKVLIKEIRFINDFEYEIIFNI